MFELKGTLPLFDPGFKLKPFVRGDLQLVGKNIHPGTILGRYNKTIDPDMLDSILDFNLDLNVGYDTTASFGQAQFLKAKIPFEKLTANFDLQKQKITLDAHNFFKGEARLNLSANQYNARMDFIRSDLGQVLKSAGVEGVDLHINGFLESFGSLPAKAKKIVGPHLKDSKGEIDLDAGIAGNFEKPQINANLTLSGVSYTVPGKDIALSGLTAGLVVTPESILIDNLKTDINGGQVGLSGNIALHEFMVRSCRIALLAKNFNLPLPSKGKEADYIKIDNLESDLLVNLTHDAKEKVLVLSDNPVPIQQINAKMDLEKTDLFLTIDQTSTLKASFNPDTLDYSMDLKFYDTLLEQVFRSAGIANFAGQISGYIRSKGKVVTSLDPDLLKGLASARGRLLCEADLKGSIKAPDFSTRIELSSIGGRIPRTNIDIKDLNAKIVATQNHLKIEEMKAAVGQGSLLINGDVGLDEYKPVQGNIRLKAKDIAVDVPDMANIVFDSDLVLSGGKEKSNLSGNIILIKGEYYKDVSFSLAGAVSQTKRKTTVTKSEKEMTLPFISDTRLDIHVNYKEPFVVDNNLAFMMIEPNLHITGTVKAPVATGRSEIHEGTVEYQKKEFEIEKGIIDFVDPYQIDPDIDLWAVSKVRDWTIRLGISGKTRNLKFTLTSEPKETYEDILSLLVAGKTTR
ncbi:MAG: hypothetical protein GY729_11200, partial [Desulfobacteraceae bacterium]|nr:hypothetical protein [Desulfobacteraceae bacterium]